MEQLINSGCIDESVFLEIVEMFHIKKIFLVCGKSFFNLPIAKTIRKSKISYMTFSGFTSNPLYEEICVGTKEFIESGCDTIMAVGGGSAIDVAKCISIFSAQKQDEDYIRQSYIPRLVTLIAVPTTAGTGSESTKFSVLYKEGVKLSIEHDSMMPDLVFLDASLLYNLPLYQKKSTLLDALCQSLESWWSVNSTNESINLAKRAVLTIMNNMAMYLNGSQEAAKHVLCAANWSGQAINLTKTTAPHAMSYKMTSLYQISHGHAVALSFPKVWRYMINHLDDCVDSRGQAYLFDVFEEMAACMGYTNCDDAIKGFETLLKKIELVVPDDFCEEDITILTESVNTERLGNNPIKLEQNAINKIYKKILESRGGDYGGKDI